MSYGSVADFSGSLDKKNKGIDTLFPCIYSLGLDNYTTNFMTGVRQFSPENRCANKSPHCAHRSDSLAKKGGHLFYEIGGLIIVSINVNTSVYIVAPEPRFKDCARHWYLP